MSSIAHNALMRAHLCSGYCLNGLRTLHSCLLMSVWCLCMFQLVCRVWPLGRQRIRFSASRRWWMVMGPRHTGPGSCRGMNSYWWEWMNGWIDAALFTDKHAWFTIHSSTILNLQLCKLINSHQTSHIKRVKGGIRGSRFLLTWNPTESLLLIWIPTNPSHA